MISDWMRGDWTRRDAAFCASCWTTPAAGPASAAAWGGSACFNSAETSTDAYSCWTRYCERASCTSWSSTICWVLSCHCWLSSSSLCNQLAAIDRVDSTAATTISAQTQPRWVCFACPVSEGDTAGTV